MNAYESAVSFKDQLQWKAEVSQKGSVSIHDFKYIVIGGMGGSHLAADVLSGKYTNIFVHSDYGLPRLPEHILSESFFIASSYSGETEETLDFAEKIVEKGYPLATISTGGSLEDFSKKNKFPYVKLPTSDLAPRFALGYSLKGLVELIGKTAMSFEIERISEQLDIPAIEEEADVLAEQLSSVIPIFYSSLPNKSLAYIWKISCNENSKSPAYTNVLPEMNHNEVTGFHSENSHLCEKLCGVFLRDEDDHKRVNIRMDKTQEILEDQGVSTLRINLGKTSVWEKTLQSIQLAVLTSVKMAENNNVDALAMPILEDLKNHLKQY
jgi:glucose/mannose-6-phosphate isomerase